MNHAPDLQMITVIMFNAMKDNTSNSKLRVLLMNTSRTLSNDIFETIDLSEALSQANNLYGTSGNLNCQNRQCDNTTNHNCSNYTCIGSSNNTCNEQ